MKYAVLSSFEVDGHSSAEMRICANKRIRDAYIKSLLLNDEGEQYHLTHQGEDENNVKYMYGNWDCGEFVIAVKAYKTYKELADDMLFCRTG